jgi:hypothetical protein
MHLGNILERPIAESLSRLLLMKPTTTQQILPLLFPMLALHKNSLADSAVIKQDKMVLRQK